MEGAFNPFIICLRLVDRPCLVVGGGEVAERKVRTLFTAGGRITVVAPVITQPLRDFIERNRISTIERMVQPEDLVDKFLVVAATDDRNANQMIAHLAHAAGILVNVADSPEESDFFVPAMLRRGDLTIAISTNGKIPALSRKIREQLEMQFGQEYARYIALLEPARIAIYKSSALSPAERKKCLHELLNLPLLWLLQNGNYESARHTVQLFLQDHGLQ